ncbi:MAG: ATPase, T2SS/T4P/T4SS family [Victivallaceae bacterium]
MLDAESQTLKDIFLSERICTEAQVLEIEEECERSGKPFSEVIINFGLSTEDQLLALMAEHLGTEVVDIRYVEIPPEVLKLVDQDMARAHGIIPLSCDNSMLTATYKNPFNYQIAEELRFITGMDVHVQVASESQIDDAVEKFYPLSIGSVHDMLVEFVSRQADENISDSDLEAAANETPVIRFVEVILTQGIKDKAADIHFEPFEHDFRIRYRVDGSMRELPNPPKSMAVPVISRIKILSNLNIAERRRPQDGRIQMRLLGKQVDLRVSCLPTSWGESTVLRILDRTVVNLDLDVLGMGKDVLAQIRDLIQLPNGIMIVAGPTGSGKTTTLYSCLKEVNHITDKILTAEDPVEYDIEGIIQLPINDAFGMNFLRALRAFLRQDPDRIMIGEIRDFETAQMSVQASLTGHFVFSTLHTNDAAGSVTRLLDMGIQPFLVCSSLVAVLSQRLIRRVCKNCRTPYDPTDEELSRFRITREELGDRKFYYGKGCVVCNNSGYKGRKAICELLVVNGTISDLIAKNAPTSVIAQKAVEQGMRSIRVDGINAVLNGESSAEEVLKYVFT